MKVENTLNTIMGAQILLNYYGFEAQREKTVRQLMDLADALIFESSDTEKIMNEMARAQALLLQMQMHYEDDEVLSLEERISAIIDVAADQEDEMEVIPLI